MDQSTEHTKELKADRWWGITRTAVMLSYQAGVLSSTKRCSILFLYTILVIQFQPVLPSTSSRRVYVTVLFDPLTVTFAE